MSVASSPAAITRGSGKWVEQTYRDAGVPVDAGATRQLADVARTCTSFDVRALREAVGDGTGPVDRAGARTGMRRPGHPRSARWPGRAARTRPRPPARDSRAGDRTPPTRRPLQLPGLHDPGRLDSGPPHLALGRRRPDRTEQPGPLVSRSSHNRASPRPCRNGHRGRGALEASRRHAHRRPPTSSARVLSRGMTDAVRDGLASLWGAPGALTP